MVAAFSRSQLSRPLLIRNGVLLGVSEKKGRKEKPKSERRLTTNGKLRLQQPKSVVRCLEGRRRWQSRGQCTRSLQPTTSSRPPIGRPLLVLRLAHVEEAHTAGPLTSGPDLVHGSHRPAAGCWLPATVADLAWFWSLAAHLTGRCFLFTEHVEEPIQGLLRSWQWALERLHKLLPQKRSSTQQNEYKHIDE
jgi:hypothetical protein